MRNIINDTNIKSKDEPIIKTDFQSFWIKVFNFAFYSMVKKSFYSFRIKNIKNLELIDHKKGTIFYANHCCWWDGVIGYLLNRHFFNTNMHVMIEHLSRFPLLSKVGAFSVEKNTPQASIKALNYCVDILKNPKNSLWIFPEGTVKPPDYRPVKFENGLAYITQKLDEVNLVPIAHRYTFVREDRPEIFVEIGKPIKIYDKSLSRKEIIEYLEQNFNKLLDNQKQEISTGNFDNYEFFMKARLCLLKLIENNFKYFVQRINT